MNIEEIKNVFDIEMKLIDNFILNGLKSNIPLINNIGEYVLIYGGKRIRPFLSILFSKIFLSNIVNAVSMASAVELIHTATLLHDDVVDVSDKRRGKVTVNKLWGNKEAILVGDFLYTRAFQMMVDVNNLAILKLMSETTNIMSEGEVYQLVNRGNFDIKESDCLNIIKCKTAQLFSAASAIGCLLSNSDIKLISLSCEYGMCLGMAYQLVDDILDYSTDDIRFGKNIGTDIFSSTFTLPLVHIMNKDSIIKDSVIDIVNAGIDENSVLKIRKLVIQSDSIDYVYSIAADYIRRAKEAALNIPKSEYTYLAISLADFVLDRKY